MERKKLNDVQKEFIFDMSPTFINKSKIMDIFLTTDFDTLELSDNEYDNCRKGKLIEVSNVAPLEIYKVQNKTKPTIIVYSTDGNVVKYIKDKLSDTEPLFTFVDTIEIRPKEIINFDNTSPEDLSLGRYLLNYMLLVLPFGEHIKFENNEYNIGKYEDKIAKALLDKIITVDQFKQYIDLGYMLLHSAELVVPTFTERSITTTPDILQKKNALLEKYKNNLNDPIVAAKIENELIALDKEWLGEDISTGFYNGVGGKAYDVHRKKLFLAVGGIESFGKDIGSYEFLKNSLSQSWDKKDMPVIANEIRKGSYNRGLETAKGGCFANNVLRVFQDTEIVEKDCNTKVGLKFVLERKIAKKFIGRYIIQNNKIIRLTSENINNYIDKEIILRSPMYCKTKTGFCEVCCGTIFSQLDVKAVNMEIVSICSVFVSLSLKSMHGTKLQIDNIDFKKQFI